MTFGRPWWTEPRLLLYQMQTAGPPLPEHRRWWQDAICWLGFALATLGAILFRGADIVETAPLDGTRGHYLAPGVNILFGGACPVQGYGTVDGHPAYYRSRGAGWSLEIELPGGVEWCFWERPYIEPTGGWVAAIVSLRCIERAVEAFRADRVTLTSADRLWFAGADGATAGKFRAQMWGASDCKVGNG